LNFVIQTTNFAFTQIFRSRSNINWNKINEYLFESCISQNDIQIAWRTLNSTLLIIIQITKNILFISVFDVKVKKLFFLTRDVIFYRQNKFHDSTIKSIMILKKIFDTNWERDIKEISLILTSVFLDDEEKTNIIKFTKWIDESNDDVEHVEKKNDFVVVNDDVRFFAYFLKLRETFSQRINNSSAFKKKRE
jgi:hypothetical protein